MKTVKKIHLFLLLIGLISFNACVENDDYDTPAALELPFALGENDIAVDIASVLGQFTQQGGIFTYETLLELSLEGALPDFVQVGNETNTDMLITQVVNERAPIDWSRNSKIISAGIRAVRRVSEEQGTQLDVMLHIAQPENVEPWFDDAIASGVVDFDLIGLSYYPKWSTTPFSEIEAFTSHIIEKFARDVVVVETAYPWTLSYNDDASNLLGQDALVKGYPASRRGQRDFLLALSSAVTNAGGLGVVYWEPAWVSTDCRTRWGRGSHWENATLFDFKGNLLPGAEFLKP